MMYLRLSILAFLFGISSLSGQNDFEDNFNKGKEQFDKQKYNEAIGFFNDALKNKDKAKNNYRIAAALQAKAYSHMYLKKYAPAVKDIKEAIELKPEYSDLYYSITMIYLKSKQYDDCIEWAGKGLALKPEFEELFLLRASAKVEKKEFKEACLDYDSVLMINSRNMQALYSMSATKSTMKLYEEAIKYSDKAIEIDAQDPAAFYNRAISKAYLKDFVGSMADMERGMSVDSTTRWTGYNNIAYFINLEQKDYKGALKYFDDAIKLNPDFAYAYSNRGFTKTKLGDLKGARKDIEKSILMDPSNSYAYKNLALLLIAEGKEGKVCEQLKKAIELGYSIEYDDEVDILVKQYCK